MGVLEFPSEEAPLRVLLKTKGRYAGPDATHRQLPFLPYPPRFTNNWLRLPSSQYPVSAIPDLSPAIKNI